MLGRSDRIFLTARIQFFHPIYTYTASYILYIPFHMFNFDVALRNRPRVGRKNACRAHFTQANAKIQRTEFRARFSANR